MVILRTRNKITDFLMILAWASPFKYQYVFVVGLYHTFKPICLLVTVYNKIVHRYNEILDRHKRIVDRYN